MGRTIKINCKKVYESGSKYEREAEVIVDIQKKLTEIGEGINEAWGGEDGHNFQVSFDQHIRQFDDIVEFLNDNAYILKGCALEHNTIDSNFNEKMKRKDIDEDD